MIANLRSGEVDCEVAAKICNYENEMPQKIQISFLSKKLDEKNANPELFQEIV